MNEESKPVTERRKKFPTRAKWLIAVFVLAALSSICPASEERHFFSAFAQLFIARILYWVLLLTPFFIGLMIVEIVEDYTGYELLGCLSGIVMAILLMLGSMYLMKHIPVVNWRIEKMFEAGGEDDY